MRNAVVSIGLLLCLSAVSARGQFSITVEGFYFPYSESLEINFLSRGVDGRQQAYAGVSLAVGYALSERWTVGLQGGVSVPNSNTIEGLSSSSFDPLLATVPPNRYTIVQVSHNTLIPFECFVEWSLKPKRFTPFARLRFGTWLRQLLDTEWLYRTDPFTGTLTKDVYPRTAVNEGFVTFGVGIGVRYQPNEYLSFAVESGLQDDQFSVPGNHIPVRLHLTYLLLKRAKNSGKTPKANN